MKIGIDVGGTKCRAVAIDADGAVLAQVELPSGRGEAQVLHTVRSVIGRLTTLVAEPVDSVGIGIPGTVDHSLGVVSHAVNLGIDELDLAGGLADLGIDRVRVDNDVNAAALGAFDVFGEEPQSLAYLNVGTGLAAGLVLDGRLRRGYRGVSGEVGHLPVGGSAPCPCGQIGCLETIASGSAIARRARAAESPFASLAEAVEQGSIEAVEILDEVAVGVADAAQTLFLVVGVDRVVLGGGVVDGTPQLVPLVLGVLDDRAATSPFLRSLDLSGRVNVAPAGLEIAAIGAALL